MMNLMRHILRWFSWRQRLIRLLAVLVVLWVAVIALILTFGRRIGNMPQETILETHLGRVLWLALPLAALLLVLFALCIKGEKRAYFAWLSTLLFVWFTAHSLLSYRSEIEYSRSYRSASGSDFNVLAWIQGDFVIAFDDSSDHINAAPFEYNYNFRVLRHATGDMKIRDALASFSGGKFTDIGLGIFIFYNPKPTAPLERRIWVLVIPWWILSLLFALFPAIFFPIRIRKKRALARRIKNGLCLTCGYDLRQSPEKCPECGAVAKQTSVT